MAKIREEHERGLVALGGAMDEERKRQFDIIAEQAEQRKLIVVKTRTEKNMKQNQLKFAAKLKRQQEIEDIKDLRIRKAELQKTISDGQKLMYKQGKILDHNTCEFTHEYKLPERQLYKFNKKLNDNLTEDFAWLKHSQQDEEKEDFTKGIVSDLLMKITELEQRVTTDVRADHFAGQQQQPTIT